MKTLLLSISICISFSLYGQITELGSDFFAYKNSNNTSFNGILETPRNDRINIRYPSYFTDTEPENIGQKKASIYFTGGTVLMASSVSGNAEFFIPLKKLRRVTSFVKVGFGRVTFLLDSLFIDPDEEYYNGNLFMLAHYGILTGNRASHFELSGGIVYSLRGEYGLFPLSVNSGWRFQKPNKHFLLRLGLGWPDILYLSLGASF